MKISFRLIDFSVYNEVVEVEDSSDSDDQKKSFGDKKEFIIQLYGIDSTGKSYSIFLDDFKPFFYISVDDNWTISKKNAFIADLKEEMGKYYENSILENECKLIKRKKLYGFDAGKNYKFILVKFRNTSAMNKVKNLYYEDKMVFDSETGKMKKERTLKENGYEFRGTQTRIYEATIPPLLRFFHIKELSPSGWVYIEKNKLNKHSTKITNCNFEYTTSYKNVKPLKSKEAIVPYKICSYDIEASSSHGDFPLAKKDYAKMTMEILDYWHTESEYIQELTREEQQNVIRVLIREAFEFENNGNISKIYTKKPIENEHQLNMMVDQILSRKVKDLSIQTDNVTQTIKSFLDKTSKNEADSGNDDNAVENSDNKNFKKGYVKPEKVDSNNTILEILNDSSLKRETKLIHITNVFNNFLPPVKGDKVTFIGSTFVKYGETEPYLNHCIALDTCDSVPGATIESYKTEAEVLLAWTRLIQRENPDIMIGYNIFGFDYQFMFERAQELGIDCLREFLKLSRNKDEICANFRDEDEFRPNKYKIEETSITIASGTHDLAFIKMKGRIQVDLYNYFRREYNLTSYKLDYVSGYFIGDKVKKLDYIDDSTIIHSKNLTGLKPGHFIHFEETGHSSEYYKDGAKFQVTEVDMETGKFMIESHETPDMNKSVKWCLAKDDVTYKDIFRMTNEGPSERAIIAKYCIQDCNLVQNLLRKIDVVTGLVEMANICSVPIDFLIMRGQSIKLFSFVAKRCRQENTVIPVLQKKDDGGYEGAIVLPPKCGLYLDEPVACVDYSSLYPSSMISENISHDSKVWAREYNLRGELINEVGIKDDNGKFLYDNLDGYKYVNIKYDTYEYLIHCKDPGCDYMTDSKAVMKAHMKNKHKKETVPGAAVKTHVGHKVCRYAQFPEGKLGIIPSILSELLAARKATRASAKFKTVSTSIGDYSGMIIDKTDEHITLKDKDGRIKIIETQSVKNIRDTYDDFMKNVLDKRQLAIKVTANSVYGQTGAKISSFYEKDVAASTTATGRKLLTYGKRIIEEVYGDKICETKYGRVHSHAEYIYGDTDSVFMSFKLTDPETGEKIVGKPALKHTIELAKEAGELATKFLKAPHDLEYEKTFMPFCLLSKKRYVGMLYEEDPDKCYRKSMGIVLKRRDNAPIVKDVYGGIIDILMKDQDVNKAIQFTRNCLNDIVDEKYPMDKLIITKSLRAFYKNPQQIAHKVLADRMGKRDPGNKPSSGDRIPFVYIQTKGKVKLQGDKIETPSFIQENNLKPDYTHYITNQIMKPVQQVFALVLEDIPEYKKKKNELARKIRGIHRKYKGDEKKQTDYENKYRNAEVKKLIFDDALRKCENAKNGQKSLRSFFG